MADRERPYLFYDVAISICSRCYRRVDAKIVFGTLQANGNGVCYSRLSGASEEVWRAQ